MYYTVDKGVQGFTFPRRYTFTSGSQLTFAPRELAAAIPIPDVTFGDLTKYAGPPLAGLAVIILLIQLAGGPAQAPSTPTNPGAPIKNPATVQLSGSRTTTHPATSTTAPLLSNQAGRSAGAAAAARVANPVTAAAAQPAGSTRTATPTGGSGGGGVSTPVPIPAPVDSVPLPAPLPQPEPPTPDPTTNAGATVTTPIAQAGVDVTVPTSPLGL